MLSRLHPSAELNRGSASLLRRRSQPSEPPSPYAVLNRRLTHEICTERGQRSHRYHHLTLETVHDSPFQMGTNLGLKPDMTSYNVLLKSCCVAGRVDLAQDIYKELKHLESVGRLKLDVFTYSTIIRSMRHVLEQNIWHLLTSSLQVFADAKMWQMALKIKQDMLSASVSLNTVAWSSLINACAHAGLVEQAIQLFEEMLLADCEPNTQCFNIILHACVEACQYDRAFRFFHSWKEIRCWDPLEKILKTMSYDGIRPDVVTYTTAIKSHPILRVKILKVWRCDLNSGTVISGPTLCMRHSPLVFECHHGCNEEDDLAVVAVLGSGAACIWNLSLSSEDEIRPTKITVKINKQNNESSKKTHSSIIASRLQPFGEDKQMKALVAYEQGEAADEVLLDDDPSEPTMGEKLASLSLQDENISKSDKEQESSVLAKPPSAYSVHVLLNQALNADDRALLLDCFYTQDEKVLFFSYFH
ncbi:hypothetical protein RIF29_13967 [Crotalaria pallida]|uniref:Pentatricopeptide repeat protein n=1 Tax=Crotalaria pallida TaxID=3830 RepID=A0AAN9FG14_CROPI